MDAKKIERTMLLKAQAKTVWDALTNPEKTRQYMFNCEVTSDWKVGHAIQWKGNYMGYESGERGIIIESKREQVLKYTSFDPNFGLADTRENYLVITYELKPNKITTRLMMTIENFNSDPQRLVHVANGWDNVVLPNLQRVVEEGNG